MKRKGRLFADGRYTGAGDIGAHRLGGTEESPVANDFAAGLPVVRLPADGLGAGGENAPCLTAGLRMLVLTVA